MYWHTFSSSSSSSSMQHRHILHEEKIWLTHPPVSFLLTHLYTHFHVLCSCTSSLMSTMCLHVSVVPQTHNIIFIIIIVVSFMREDLQLIGRRRRTGLEIHILDEACEHVRSGGRCHDSIRLLDLLFAIIKKKKEKEKQLTSSVSRFSDARIEDVTPVFGIFTVSSSCCSCLFDFILESVKKKKKSVFFFWLLLQRTIHQRIKEISQSGWNITDSDAHSCKRKVCKSVQLFSFVKVNRSEARLYEKVVHWPPTLTLSL